jgi:hypothetical protein
MSGRAATLQLIDDALTQVSGIEAVLRAARDSPFGALQARDVATRFRAIAQAGTGRNEFASVQELAALAEKVTDGTDRSILHTGTELEIVQQAADVLSLLLRDMGHQLLGRRGANVAPAAGALREQLERLLLTDTRR